MRNFFIGILIGSGAILPGVSSGVFCVVFGLYEKLVDACLHFFRDIKKNFTFLFPIVLGALVGIFLFSNVLQVLFNKFFIVTSYAFIGLILGSLPIVIRQGGISKITFSHFMCLILSFVFSIYLVVLEKNEIFASSSFSSCYLILCGVLMSAGVVIPGVSKTVILMMLGVYPSYLTAISTLDFSILIPIGFGLVLGGAIFMFIINFLFDHFKSYTYFLILGFVLGSILVIFPGFEVSFQYILGVVIAILCFLATYKIGK